MNTLIGYAPLRLRLYGLRLEKEKKNINGWGKNSDWRANGKWRECTYSNPHPLQMFEVYIRKLV